MKNLNDKTVVKPSILYIFLGSIFIFAMVLFLASCTQAEKEDPQPGLVITSISPSEGAIGAPVTVNGTNFDEDTSNNTVLFNDTPALVSSSSKTSISVVVPDGATTGKISVQVNGKTVTSSQNFIVVQ
ncbi:hypothetical protein BH09BAC3_BH09BAC3_30170 [soil metagenome]